MFWVLVPLPNHDITLVLLHILCTKKKSLSRCWKCKLEKLGYIQAAMDWGCSPLPPSILEVGLKQEEGGLEAKLPYMDKTDAKTVLLLSMHRHRIGLLIVV